MSGLIPMALPVSLQALVPLINQAILFSMLLIYLAHNIHLIHTMPDDVFYFLFEENGNNDDNDEGAFTKAIVQLDSDRFERGRKI